MKSKNGPVVAHTCPYLIQGYGRCRCTDTPLYEYRTQTRVICAWDAKQLTTLTTRKSRTP